MPSDDFEFRRNSIILYVFSGLHAGAQIALLPGTVRVGSDDSCDLILSGLEKFHAELQVEDTPNLTLIPAHGKVLYKGQPLTESVVVEPGEPWYLGTTLFVWNKEGEKQEFLTPDFMAGESQIRAGSGGTPEQSDTNAVKDAEDTEEAKDATKDLSKDLSNDVSNDERDNSSQNASSDDLDATAAASETAQPTEGDGTPIELQKPKKTSRLARRFIRLTLLLVLAVFFGVLSLSFTSSTDADPNAVGHMLKEQGFYGLEVLPYEKGLLVQGAVSGEEERKKILHLLEQLEYPVSVSISLDEDLERATRNAMGLLGFYPLVSVQRDKANDFEPRLEIACFMRDQLVETAAFADLEESVASPPKKVRRIVYANDVLPKAKEALRLYGFTGVDVIFLPGQARFSGNCPPERQHALQEIQASLTSQFAVPLFGETEVIEVKKGSQQSGGKLALTVSSKGKKNSDGQAPEGEEKVDLGGLIITGVFIAPLSFITTEDGQYLFEGSLLPNGDLLERITATTLTIKRKNQRYTYSLRGK